MVISGDANVAGSLYVLAGPSAVDASIFRVNGSFAAAREIVPAAGQPGRGAGFDSITAGFGHLIVDDGRDVTGRIRLLRPTGSGATLGPVLESRAWEPTLGPNGRFAYGSNQGETTLSEASLDAPHTRRVLIRSHQALSEACFGPSGQLATSIGTGMNARVQIGLGEQSSRTIRASTPGFEYLVCGGPDSLMATSSNRGEMTFISWNGATTHIKTTWIAVAFSPNKAQLLVASPNVHTLGVMSLATHRVTTVASITHGVFGDAAWVA